MTLSDEQGEALAKLMKDDLQTNRTAFIAGLIGAEVQRRRDERNKRGVGRPRKGVDEGGDEVDYSDDLPKDILHFGRMIGKRELADIEETQRAFQPKGN